MINLTERGDNYPETRGPEQGCASANSLGIMSIKDLRAAYLVLCIAMSATWDDRSLAHFFLFLGLAVLIKVQYAFRDSSEFLFVTWPPVRRLSPLETSEAIFVSVLLLGPYFYILLSSWSQEYPFLTDHTHHVMATIATWNFWICHKWHILLLVFPGAFIAQKTRNWKLWIFITFALFLLSGEKNGMPSFFSRYPAIGYFLALPFNLLGHLFEWPTLHNVNRLSHIFSIAAWLFVLRPRIVKKWPDMTILPFGIFIFYQKDVAYYFSSVFLEPWALIFLMTAAEYLIKHPRRPEFSLYLVGFAAMIKEQAIFCLPFFVLVFRPWHMGVRELFRTMAIAIIAIVPFAFYFHKRQLMQTWRHSTIADFSSIIDPERYTIFKQRLGIQFGEYGLALILGALALAILMVLFSQKNRLIIACFLAIAMFQVVYFYTDEISQSFTGYSRFSLISLIFLATPLLLAARKYKKNNQRVLMWILAGMILLMQLPTFLPFLRTYSQSSISRNFFEHHDGPIHFPIRQVLDRAERSNDLELNQDISIVFPFGTDRKLLEIFFPMAYPQFNQKYRFSFDSSERSFDCTCGPKHQAKIVLFVYYNNLGVDNYSADESKARLDTCRAQLKSSCLIIREEYIDGRPVALTGFSSVAGNR